MCCTRGASRKKGLADMSWSGVKNGELLLLIEAVAAAVDSANPGTFATIECGRFIARKLRKPDGPYCSRSRYFRIS